MQPNTMVTTETPLKPFRGVNATFLNSLNTVDLRNWGYSYESLEYWHQNETQLQTAAARYINTAYGPVEPNTRRHEKKRSGKNHFFVKLEVDVENVPRPCGINVYVAGELVGTAAVLGHPATGILHAELPLERAIVSNDLRRFQSGEKTIDVLEKNMQVEFIHVRIRYNPEISV